MVYHGMTVLVPQDVCSGGVAVRPDGAGVELRHVDILFLLSQESADDGYIRKEEFLGQDHVDLWEPVVIGIRLAKPGGVGLETDGFKIIDDLVVTL